MTGPHPAAPDHELTPASRDARGLVVGLTPFGEPCADLVVAIERAGGLGVLDLGSDAAAALSALTRVRSHWHGRFGVRLGAQCPISPASLPAEVDTLVTDAVVPPEVWQGSARRVLVEVTSVDEARQALARGAAGVIAKGSEAGGRVGSLSTFILLQQLLAECDAPVWAMGGIGRHTAAAAVAGGARGVVLDSQFALVTETGLPGEVAAALMAMDGSETTVASGYRVYTRPDLPVPDPASGHFGARDLHGQLLPVGQDGAFAGPLAAVHKTAGGVVQAVRTAVTSQLGQAARDFPLTGAVPVQGPMTRVSDRAAFAAAVAGGGGLPFLALALMSGEETQRLLGETAAALGGHAWGVGILGFAPPEVRQAQLAAITRARPPYALIAGGRPAQAAALEEAGIETFLHVPSPGLLDLFLREGARRFVFEGSECGGHIGPRGSFALWEAQVGRLLAWPDLTGVRVWFAGGVHDERSAAMVAAMAAPLTARGARVSVLMGTAYLFTEEAVRCGAVLPGYQGAALACTATALLETSPGHVVRCADTPYVAGFARARQRLADAGTPPQQAWAELEQLNLGRLRIAAKGVRRDGGTLTDVGEDIQHSDGMVMLGQVATLRSEVTTVAALHSQVINGAQGFLTARAAELALGATVTAPQAGRPLDIAIVGMACVYPGADGLGAYWANVVAGTDATTDVPPERWRHETFPDLPSARGGFLPQVPFDALAYGIPPSSLPSIEPVQLLALEVAARALDDAGYAERPFDREKTSVVFGAEAGSDLSAAYGLRSALPTYAPVPADVEAHLPRLTEDSFPGVLSNVIAGRVANRLDLGGVNYTVDAACASSLAALDLACKELAAGTSDMVLCGGADTHNGSHDFAMFASVHALSPSGRCAPFDASADGIALGEGVACVVLKRLADAERDGDRVYAVVKGVAGSSDGRSLGLTAPRPEGQRRALDRAYAMAGLSPADVGLIEAHGTGTVVGDRAELATLTALFTESGASRGTCVVGSVKSQIGHTKCAAGLAGLIKVANALHTGVRPGTVHLSTPNPGWDAATSPFTFATSPRPWAAEAGGRHAGVSAFGFGGTNFHAVLSGYDGADEPAHGLREWPAELVVFRGDASAAAARLRRLTSANDAAGRPWRLADLAATMAADDGPVRAALVATDLDDLAARAGDPLAEQAAGGPVAFLFPGQGSQRPGMLREVFTAFPRLQRLLRLAGGRYADAMFPPAAFSHAERDRQQAAITDTRVAQPALGIAGLAMLRLLGDLGVRPDMAGGHSYGELLALCAAGAYDEACLLDLSQARAGAILAAAGEDPGAMAAVSAPAQRVIAALDGTGVVLANHNSPTQVVVSGPTPDVEAAITALAAAGMTARRLPVACAFHSPLVAGAAQTLAGTLAALEIQPPSFPVFANATAAPYPATPDGVRAVLARQVAEPVRFAEQVEAMYAAGARTFVEAGPGRVLTGLVGAVLGERPHTALACDVPGENGLARLLATLAGLVRAGVPVDPAALFAGRAEPVAEPAPRRPRWTVDGQLVRTADGQPLPGGLQPATTAPQVSVGPAASPDVSDRDRVVTEFLSTTRELLAAQRDVVLGYLGAPANGTAAHAASPAGAASAGGSYVGTRLAGATPDGAGPASIPGGAASALTAAAGPTQPALAAPGTAEAGTAAPGTAEAGTAEAGTAEAASPADIRAAVVDVVSARTGYPRDMLGTDLDLEADLSIDSIKRTEIIGALAERLGLPSAGAGPDESVIDSLARIKTIGGIADWLSQHLGTGGDHPGADSPGPAGVSGVPAARAGMPGRHVVETVEVEPAAGGSALPARTLIVDDGAGIALELTDLLEARGAEVVTVEAATEARLAGVEAVVHLGALRPGAGPVLPEAFTQVRDVLAAGVRTLIVATTTGGTFGIGCTDAASDLADLGLRGMVRSVAAEYPAVTARAVDVAPKDGPRDTAAQLLAELTSPQGPVVVGYRGGRRTGLRVRRAELPPGSGTPAALDNDSVVLLTGGARGITAAVAHGLARASGCHVELIGRTPLADPDPEAEAAEDPGALRRLLAQRGMDSPREIEAAAGRLLREREVRATLAGLRAVASSVRYHPVDVRDTAGVGYVVDDIYARHGRLDGVIHGAGVVEDRLLPDKSAGSFERVYATKVDGARALTRRLRPGTRFLVLFGSVSGVFGNRGQVDYGAANDALDTLAHLWSAKLADRVVCLDWGPWAGVGMVSAELARSYARRGVTLIDADAGVACLLAELAANARPAQVVYMCEPTGDD